MPRELEMETVTIYCLQSHSGDIFIVLSWAESRAPVAPGIMTLVATWPGQATGQGRLYATYCHIFIISWFGKILPVYSICQLVLILIFLKNMRVIKTRPGPGSPRCCWWQCRCGAVRWWEVMQGRAVFSVPTSASKSSIRRFVIMEKAPTRAFSWFKAATTAFTFKTLLRHYAKWALTPHCYTFDGYDSPSKICVWLGMTYVVHIDI